MARYNGHKNFNHWNVSLWINNDEMLYDTARYCIRTTNNRREAADKLRGMLPSHTPDGAPYSRSSLMGALVGMQAS
jgi:hypothetical protein